MRLKGEGARGPATGKSVCGANEPKKTLVFEKIFLTIALHFCGVTVIFFTKK